MQCNLTALMAEQGLKINYNIQTSGVFSNSNNCLQEVSQNSSDAQYSLKWNNHQNNMISVFNRLLGNEQFTDVLIAAEGRKIRAHKVNLKIQKRYKTRQDMVEILTTVLINVIKSIIYNVHVMT